MRYVQMVCALLSVLYMGYIRGGGAVVPTMHHVAGQAQMIERQLSILILTLNENRFHWVRQEIEQLVTQVRALMVGAHGGYELPQVERSRVALQAIYAVLPHLILKLASTIQALEARGAMYSYSTVDQELYVRALQELTRLHALLKQECAAAKHMLEHLC